MRQFAAFNVKRWLEENRHLLKPPVGNRVLADGEFKVMVVAGPNERTDYHVENHEEIFYQLEGDLILKFVDESEEPPRFDEVHVGGGELFALPARVPHSPQRLPGSIGLVVERERDATELDRLRWYCQQCRSVMYEESFHCADLTKDLLPVIQRYRADQAHRTCKQCGWVEHV
ncbi:hypothetical protein CDCA_CDCA06G1959 [Cyanidium caldarium]|uniref:3-hydroxyanthranilate 3,4-dioxygenase n=1 Tax=Cyanidium caldarium TaxID=2771 RepID=A0AAV9IUI5_CYACA|nr:hypothetical protein CDCA_CDCA06G1959 [Cyanidium caldarium]